MKKLQELLEQLRGLDPNDPGRWPVGVRLGTAILLFVLVAAGGYYFFVWKSLHPQLVEARAKETELLNTLEGKGPFTVFAPTDEAFAKLPAGTLDGLLADTEKLKKVLLHHVVAGNVSSKQVVKLTSAKTVEGEMVKIDTSSGVKVNGGPKPWRSKFLIAS